MSSSTTSKDEATYPCPFCHSTLWPVIESSRLMGRGHRAKCVECGATGPWVNGELGVRRAAMRWFEVAMKAELHDEAERQRREKRDSEAKELEQVVSELTSENPKSGS